MALDERWTAKTMIKRVERICATGFTLSRVWSDFLEMAYTSLAKQVHILLGNEGEVTHLEERYMAAIRPYADRDVRFEFPRLLGDVTLALGENPAQDLLGSVASEMSVLHAGLGQFFTPWGIARAMAAMTLKEVGGEIDRKGYVTVHEPACGAGVMILAAADVMREQGHDPATTMLVDAVDLSPNAFKMTWLQLHLTGIAARVHHGDALAQNFQEHAPTGGLLTFYRKHGHVGRRKIRARTRTRPVKPETIAAE